MNRMPLALPALALLAGVVGWEAGMGWWVAAGCCGAGALLLCCRRTVMAVTVLMCGAGWLLAMLKSPAELPEEYEDRHTAFSGYVTAMGYQGGGRSLRVSIDSLDGEPVPQFQAAILVSNQLPFIDAGFRVSGAVEFSTPDCSEDLPGAVDYDRILARQGVRAKAFVSGDSISGHGYAPGIRGTSMQIRRHIIDGLRSLDVATPCAAFLCATVAADRTLMNPDTRHEFASAGLAHILAISGLHVGLLAWLVLTLLRPFGRKPSYMVALVAVWGYAFVGGLPPSAVRAAVMISLLLMAGLLYKRNSPVNALAAALILFIWFEPSAVTTISFQLSFCATLGILVFAEPFNPFNQRSQPKLYRIASPMAATIAATLGTALWVVGEFHTFPIMFLPANIVASLVGAPLIGLGFLMAALAGVGIHIHPLCRLADGLYGAIEQTAGGISALGWSEAEGIYLPVETLALAAVGIVALAWAVNMRRARPIYLLAVMAASGALMSATLAPKPEVAVGVAGGKRMGPYATILITTPDTLYVATNARGGDRLGLEERLSNRYKPYMLRHGVREMKVIPLPQIVRTDSLEAVIYTGSEPRHRPTGMRRVLYLCAPFKGDAGEVAGIMRADSVVLVEGFDRRVMQRHCRVLDTCRVAHRHFP